MSVIQAGDFFQASELRSKDGQTYLKLADQDGDLVEVGGKKTMGK